MGSDEIERQILAAIEKLTAVSEELDQRLAKVEAAAITPQPLQGVPSYMSGRWYRRDGTSFGQPP